MASLERIPYIRPAKVATRVVKSSNSSARPPPDPLGWATSSRTPSLSNSWRRKAEPKRCKRQTKVDPPLRWE